MSEIGEPLIQTSCQKYKCISGDIKRWCKFCKNYFSTVGVAHKPGCNNYARGHIYVCPVHVSKRM